MYSTIYKAQFYDNVNHDKIDIYINQKDFGGVSSNLMLDANPLVISYPNKEFTDNIFSCGCKINIVNNSSDFFKFDSLFSKSQKKNYIEIIKTSNNLDSSIILFQGYVLPEMYTTTLEKNIKLTIPATDQLAQLDRYTPMILVDSSSLNFRAEEFPNANDIIFQCISDLDVTNKLAINNRLENINYVKNSSTTIFDNIFFDANNFYDSKNKVNNDNEVLTSILKTFYSRIYYYDGKFIIERIPDLGKLNKQYTYYTNISDPADDWSDVSSYSVSNERIDLSKHNLLSRTAQLTFNPGYQTVNIKLNYNKQSNLVDNYYFDWTYLDSSISSEFRVDTRPAPSLKKWKFSAHGSTTCSSVYPDASLSAEEYHDSNLPTGLRFTLGPWYPITTPKWNWLAKQFASTQLQLNPEKDKTLINVKYLYSIDPGNVSTNDIYKGKFALRTIDADGSSWWVAKNNVNDTNTFWSSTEYKFESTMNYSSMANYKFEVSQTIDITGCVSDTAKFKKTYDRLQYIPGLKWLHKHWVTHTYYLPANNLYVGNLYLDIYAMEIYRAWYAGTQYLAVHTHFGEVYVTVEPKIYPDTIEGQLNDFNDAITYEIDLFDCSTSLYTNGIYNRNDNDDTRLINEWKENGENNLSYLTIQKRLLQDLTQMYNNPRYSLSLDVRSKDSSIWTLGNVYTHSNIVKDGSLLEFICNGYDYNVKENSYRLNLLEYKADDNWRINPQVDSFSINPTYLNFLSDGGSQDITISTNVGYTYDTSLTNLTLTPNGYNLTVIAPMNNSTNAIDGSISFLPVGLPEVKASIHQDASMGEFIPDLDVMLVDHFLYWNYNTGGACTIATFDVSSNASWSVPDYYGSGFMVLPQSGNAGITSVHIDYTPYDPPENKAFYFYIGETSYDYVVCESLDGCP